MENEIERIRSDQERDLHEEITKLLSNIEESKLKPGEISNADLLLFLGHIVSILDSEWGTMHRMLRLLESQQALLNNPHGENGVTLKDIFEQGASRKKIMKKILGVAVSALAGIIIQMIISYSSDREADRKRDALLQQNQKTIELLMEKVK